MPYVTPSAPSSLSLGTDTSFTLYMRPLYDHALVSLIKLFKWAKLFYLYDSDEGEWVFISCLTSLLLQQKAKGCVQIAN